MIFKPINNGLSNWLSSILSINKGLSDTAKFSKLSISNFSKLSQKIDDYNTSVVGKANEKENWNNKPVTNTFTAYTQQLSTNEKATREGYNQYISQYSTGLTGVSNTMAQYNKLAEKGISNQNEYAKAIATTNPKLGSYLTSLNGAKAGMSGYAIQLAGATVKTVALQAATIALDAALSMGISLAIGGLISGIDYLVHRNEKLIESANEVTNTYRDQAKTLSEGITSLQEQQNDFDSLAKGVDEYGNNISLTTDQYKQYQSIVSEILGYSPELIAGYDEEGNAIAKKNGLIEESIRLMKEERKQKLNEITTASNTKTIYKGAKAEYNNSRGDLTNESFDVPVQSELHSPLNNYGKGSDSFSNVYTVQHFNSIIKDITGEDFLDGEKLTDYLKRNEEIIKKNYDEISRQMKQDVYTANGTIFGLSKDDTQTFVNWLQEVYNSIDEVEKQSHGMDEQFNLFAQKSDAYEKLTNEQKNFITNYIKETGKITDAEGKLLSDDELLKKANNYKAFVDELDKRADVKEAITSFYTAPEDDESIPEYISSVKDAFTIIQEFAKENGVEIPLDFTKDYDDLQNQYVNVIQSLNEKFNNSPTIEDAIANLNDEYQKISDWGLDDYADDIKNGTIQSKFANIDMDKRTIITWSDELKETYKDELASWEYDPEIGSIDTVFGGNDRFGEDLNGTGWEIAFTPILPDGTFLSRDTVNDYINSILADAYSDDGTVTEEELSAIDAEGRQIGDTFVQGIFGAIDDNTNEDDNWANVVGRLMHFSGKYGAVNLANEEIERAKNSDPDFDWEAWFKENSINTKEELDAWQKVTAGINDATKARKAYLDYMNQQKLDTKSLKELNDSLDKIQSAYQTVSTAIEEYNENGYLSVDTFQSLMELEPEYLGLLMDENGTLALTSENLYKLTEARINDLAAKQASTLVDSVTKLGSEAEQLDYLTQSTKEATESTWGLVYAKIAEAQAAGTISDDVAGRLKSRVDAYQTWAKNTIDGINKGSLGKSSNSSKSEKDKAKALKDYNDKLKDINEKLEELDKAEHLSNLKYSIETITQDLDTFEKSLDRLSSKLDLTFEKDYSAKLSIIGQQFLGASRYGGEMRVELERLLAIEPQTADEAEELASRLESLSDSFFENEKNIIEYRNSLFETATDYLGESASATVEQVNNAKSILDNTFNVIKNGSLSGDGFWSATLLPSISKDKVTKQRAENNKLIKEEKRYQNAIAKIRKKATDMSYAEEKEEREKQRQEYQEELQEAYEDYQDKINDVIGKNIEVSDSVKNIGDEYMNTADKAENAAQRMSDAVDNINWQQRSYANKSYNYEEDGVDIGAPTSAQYQYAYGDSKSTVVITKKAQGGTTSQGLTITGDGTGAYAGQEAYIGQDGKLHLFNNEAQLSELPPNTRIVNAKDLQNIIKYTGMKYFYQPIENIQSATVDKFAQGNTNVSFSPIPYNTLSTQALYSDINVQAMVEETIAEINNEFNSLKGNIKFSAVQNAFKNSLTDKKMYEDLSNTIVNMTSQSLDKADKSTLSDSIVGLILQNSAWDDLPNELQNKLSELNVNADNWTDWIKDSNNSLQAFNLMQDGGMSSWDLLDSNVTSLLQQAGINGKDAWDKFVQDDPLQALTLLSSSWNSMNDTIGQYMTDAQTIAANGARAIQSLQIIAPSISEQSWNALQVLIANKIQEIISLMNEVFGENTVD